VVAAAASANIIVASPHANSPVIFSSAYLHQYMAYNWWLVLAKHRLFFFTKRFFFLHISSSQRG